MKRTNANINKTLHSKDWLRQVYCSTTTIPVSRIIYFAMMDIDTQMFAGKK